ncbi:hypothetical protein OIU77_025148 [Salix suchowensis]|uniref:DNA-3-methyladenine glycosylase I n=1 Tax=Salix suchowensis TaxID=1278906 RepID=A0ABQ9BV71_9ROSI|nr:hypothetical protein OIU77_025148 [Salix suchowensis]
MSGATKLHSATKQVHEPPRAILGPTGNRARVLEEGRRKIEVLQKSQQKPKKPVEKMSQAAVKNNLSVDSTCSSDSSSSSSGVSSSSRKNVKHYGTKKVKDVRNGGEIKDVSSKKEGPVKRCDWITPNSDPLYMSFHDEEWGVPVYDDRKLFELLIQQEFGSFSNYCWRFVNQKPLRNGFRYARQVPVKTPKAELMSKDLMQRGFRCVGPTAVYSFMQVAGFVNDHLQACFRYKECNAEVKKNFKPRSEETEMVTEASGNTWV